MSDTAFTGERLHGGDALFAVDLARHEAAYLVAQRRAHDAAAHWVLDLGSGAGHGAAALAASGLRVAALDRVAPDRASRGAARFVRADLGGVPFAPGSFDLVASFQVIEHLEDPSDYVAAIAGLLRPGGTALVTTPNRLTSDGVNPYHVHEYVAGELADVLRRRFAEVEVQGIGMSERVRAHMQARSRRIRAIVRLDPLRLRERLPRALTERLFALFAVLVRKLGRTADGPLSDVSWRDYPIGPAAPECLDLLAICRGPRP